MTAPSTTLLFLWGARSPQPDERPMPQEVADAVTLGFNAYHLAVDWAAVEPEPGAWDDRVLHHLRKRLLALRQAGLEPILTLHRGAEPAWFSNARGWLRGDAVQLFCRFVVKIVEEVGDLVALYITLEAPTRLALRYTRQPDKAVATSSWELALSAPSTWALRRALRAFLHAHGAARRTLRGATPHHGPRPAGEPLAGITLHMHSFVPRRADSPIDRAAAVAASYLWDTLPLRVLVDGRFHAPLGHGESLQELRGSLDFVGVMPGTRVRVPVTGGPERTDSAKTDGDSLAGILAVLAMIRRVVPRGKPLVIVDGVPSGDRPMLAAEWLEDRRQTVALILAAGYDVRGWLFPPMSSPLPGNHRTVMPDPHGPQ